MSIFATKLVDRACLRISGPDASDFLQNLITQDIALCTAETLRMAALLTPQGKVLFDFLIFTDAAGYVLDCDTHAADALTKRLKLYKLRANITIEKTDHVPMTLWQSAPYQDKNAPAPVDGFLPDPRHALLGLRGLNAPPQNVTTAPLADWQAHRLRLGVPQGTSDTPPGAAFPLEFGFVEMGAIDFQKGCFIGQEVTSRTHRKGTLRKRLWPVHFEQAAPPADTPVMIGERMVGTIVAAHDELALALLRDDGDAATMQAAEQRFTIGTGLFGVR